MRGDFGIRKVNLEQQFQLGQVEVGWTVVIPDQNGFSDFSVLKAPQLAIGFFPNVVKLLNL
jgi:hypothetical protein